LRKLTIVFHHAGGGHQSAAEALKATLSSQEHPWDVSLLDNRRMIKADGTLQNDQKLGVSASSLDGGSGYTCPEFAGRGATKQVEGSSNS